LPEHNARVATYISRIAFWPPDRLFCPGTISVWDEGIWTQEVDSPLAEIIVAATCGLRYEGGFQGTFDISDSTLKSARTLFWFSLLSGWLTVVSNQAGTLHLRIDHDGGISLSTTVMSADELAVELATNVKEVLLKWE